MLRVAHLLPNMVAGGRERVVADLCRLAATHDIEPHIICYDPDSVGSDIETPHVARHVVDRAAPHFPTRLRHLLATEQIDILHCQGHIAAALAWPVMRDLPAVTTLHVALGGGWRWLPDIISGLRGSQVITAVSDDLARRFRPLSSKPIIPLIPGIDLARFAPVARPPSCQPFTIGIAARLHPVKRHRDAIAAIQMLADTGYRCRLLIAGQGPEDQALRRAAATLDVTFVGHVPDMPGWLSSLDAFLLPSDHEGSPLALMEALACGLPCIATAVGGIPDMVGDAAMLIPKRRPAAIASAIAELIDADAERTRLSLAASRRSHGFSVQQFGERVAQLYLSMR